MQPENFIRSHKNPLSHKVRGKMVLGHSSIVGLLWKAWPADPSAGPGEPEILASGLLGTVLGLVSGQRGG